MSVVWGDGLKRVAILADEPDELKHFNLHRLVKKAGLQKEDFFYGTVTPGWRADLDRLGVTTVIPTGEYALRAVLAESGIKRWRGRAVWASGSQLWAIPTWKASRLLHRKQPLNAPRDPDIQQNPPRFSGQFIRDLHFALQVQRDGGFSRREFQILEDPDAATFDAWVREFLAAYAADPTLVLSYDIETPYKLKNRQEDELEESESKTELNTTILRISFSYRDYEAVSVVYDPARYPGIRTLLELAVAHLGWNSNEFDYEVLLVNDVKVAGIQFDGMDLWKAYKSDLPRGIEAVSADTTDVLPWKHLADVRPAWYNGVDSAVALLCFKYIRRKLQEQGLWDSVMHDFVELMPELKEAGKNGIPIDLAKQAELREKLRIERERIDAEIQVIVPRELKPRHRYKREPFPGMRAAAEAHGVAAVTVPLEPHWNEPFTQRDFDMVMEPNEIKVCSRCGAKGVTKGGHTQRKALSKTLIDTIHHKKCILSGALAEAVWPKEMLVCSCAQHAKGWPKKKWKVTPNPCHGAELRLETHPTPEWDEILPFNAGSSEQLKAYMRAHGHPIGVNKDDPEKESADKKHLESLVKRYGKKFPLYSLALERHLVTKTESTYLWEADEKQLIHQSYVNSPSTHRLAGRAYNLTNVGKRDGNPWAKEAREQIIAWPGWKIVNADSSAIEAVILGWKIGDAEFIDVASKSIHAWLVCKEKGWDFNPDNVEKVKSDHRMLYDQFKITFYGTVNGMTAYKLWMDYPDYFPRLKAAEGVLDRIYRILPKLEEYQYRERYLAQKQGYITGPFGYRHEFYDVYTLKRDRYGNQEYTASGKPKLKLGKDGKRAVSYEHQHAAAIFGRRSLRLIAASEWRPFMPANLFVHDGYALHVPDELVDGARGFMREMLTRPIPELGGLRVGCEVEVGQNWGSYHVHSEKCQKDGPCKQHENPLGMQTIDRVVIEKQDIQFWPTSTEKAA